ncbi:RNA methyltransferase, TrmH family [Nocardioides scoriae]|uniref:RNA methyltransferase, TrmH family n=1 Tax=Nocardioides scoriae TaxID=642780 RepID=A0A1H1PNA3_9ACTN|nr:RNA methyltransferase [Nocardioides scoriae]SDS12575.1 RNA methyltransferase, TrmH family [Nocardioides scoriae]
MASFRPERPLSKSSGRVKAARKLARRASRLEHGLFLAEGVKALTEALAVTEPGATGVVEVFATEAAGDQHAALRSAVEQAGCDWWDADDDAVASLSGSVSPQGVVAVCRSLHVGLDLALAGEGTVAICADVRDPGNAGTVIRTADASGAVGVVLAGHSVDPYNDKTVRATVGSLWHLPIALEPDPAEAVRRARASGRPVLAADGAGETDLFDAEDAGLLDQPVAWLFGNEAWGLPEELAALADHRVSIPVLGRAESLNLSTAAAVCLYASARRS